MISRIFLFGCEAVEKQRETIAKINYKTIKRTQAPSSYSVKKQQFYFASWFAKCKQKAYSGCISMHGDFSDVPDRIAGLSLKKTPHVWLPHAKTTFYCYGVQLWPVISIKLNIGEKITRLEMLALNREKIYHVCRLIELICKGELHCLYNGFLRMESQLNMKLQMNYLQKDNWAHSLLKFDVQLTHIKFCMCNDSISK